MNDPQDDDNLRSAQQEALQKAHEPVPETEKILGRSPDTPPEDVAPAEVPTAQPQDIKPEWKPYYEKLLKIRDYILDQQRDLDDKATENQPSFIKQVGDAGTESYLRDYALGMVSNYQEMLYEIGEALQRIQSGNYGVCEATGKPIPPERLDALPWTRFTVEAEAKLEEDGKAPVRPHIAPRGSTAPTGTQAAAQDARNEKGP